MFGYPNQQGDQDNFPGGLNNPPSGGATPQSPAQDQNSSLYSQTPPPPKFDEGGNPIASSPPNPTPTTTPAPNSLTPPPSDKDNPNLEAIITSPHTPQKYGGKKIIATIFGVLILIGGVAAGVFLVQRQQEIAERAASGRECSHSPDCILLDEPGNSGSYTTPREISYIFITAKEFHKYEPGETNDGCYQVKISGRSVSWNRVGGGPNCKDISNVQIWMRQEERPSPTPEEEPTQPPQQTPTHTPSISASCNQIKVYDTNWNQLTSDQLKQLKPGDRVRFTVSGTASEGTFDMAQFTINGVERDLVTHKKPQTEEFYDEYIIPSGNTEFSVSAKIHHSVLGWF